MQQIEGFVAERKGRPPETFAPANGAPSWANRDPGLPIVDRGKTRYNEGRRRRDGPDFLHWSKGRICDGGKTEDLY